MARFAFEARDRQGRVVRGTREAESPGALASALSSRQLSITQIRPAPEAAAPAVSSGVALAPAPSQAVAADAAPPLAPRAGKAAPRVPAGPGTHGLAKGNAGAGGKDWTSRASAMEVSLYFRQAQALLHAGSSTSHALAVASRHGSSAALRRASEEMSRSTAAGQPWSELMGRYPGLFSDLAVGMVAAGEASGRVDEACRRLADYSERDFHLQQTIKRETWYPKLLVACSILIPSVVPLVLSGPGAWLASVRGPLLLVAGVSLGWRALQWAAPLRSQARSVNAAIDGVKMRLPVAGKVSRGFASAKFCRALGATVGAGVPVNQAMSLAGRACGNAVLQGAAEKARLQVLEGETLTGALSATGQFPPVAMQMLATGEATGQTEEQLEKVADFLEGGAETAVKQAVKLLAVLALLIVAWQIGAQVVSFYTGFSAGVGAAVDGEF